LKRIKEYQCVEVGQRIRLLRSNFHPRGTILFVCEVWEWSFAAAARIGVASRYSYAYDHEGDRWEMAD
jgi:hypothetical protein